MLGLGLARRLQWSRNVKAGATNVGRISDYLWHRTRLYRPSLEDDDFDNLAESQEFYTDRTSELRVSEQHILFCLHERLRLLGAPATDANSSQCAVKTERHRPETPTVVSGWFLYRDKRRMSDNQKYRNHLAIFVAII